MGQKKKLELTSQTIYNPRQQPPFSVAIICLALWVFKESIPLKTEWEYHYI